MNCRAVRTLLSAYIDGELTAAQAASVEAHLDQCSACQTALAELKSQDLVLRAVLAKPIAVSPLLTQRVISEVQRRQAEKAQARFGFFRLPFAKPALLAAAVLALIVISVFAFSPKSARVVAVQGKPLCSTASHTGWNHLRSGMRVSDGTRVKTAIGEMATIRWPDGSEVVIGAQTDATALPESKPSGVVLNRGLIYARIRPQQLGFYVRGPQATATVLGTEFWLEARGNATSLFVIRGKVRFANAAGQVVVTRWKKSTAVAGRAPSPLQPTSPLDANSFWWLRHSQPRR